MRTLALLLSLLLLTTLVGACDDNKDDNGADQSDVSTDLPTDTETPQEQGFGSPCTCTDDGASKCEIATVPTPASGNISGCDDVPTDWAGGARACVRTYAGPVAPDLFFANGFCTLMATHCDGEDAICTPATFGDYAAFTACPEGLVFLEIIQHVTVLGQDATVTSRICAPSCESDADCRLGEVDPALQGQASQYGCQEKDGVKFCLDPRNLEQGFTATQN